MPRIHINHQELFYTRRFYGSGAPDLLLIHGAASSHLFWPAELRRLPGANVYALDLPGHGRSQPPGRDQVADYAADVAAFIEALSLDNVVLAGHSMGGAIVQTLALEPLPAIQGIILIATGARLRVDPLILELVAADFPAAIDRITGLAWGPEAPLALVEAGRSMMLTMRPEAARGDYLACDSFDFMTRLPAITLPALVISGSRDQLAPEKYGRYLADQLPNGQFISMEAAGHMLPLERPQPIAAAVSRFIAQLGR